MCSWIWRQSMLHSPKAFEFRRQYIYSWGHQQSTALFCWLEYWRYSCNCWKTKYVLKNCLNARNGDLLLTALHISEISQHTKHSLKGRDVRILWHPVPALPLGWCIHSCKLRHRKVRLLVNNIRMWATLVIYISTQHIRGVQYSKCHPQEVSWKNIAILDVVRFWFSAHWKVYHAKIQKGSEGHLQQIQCNRLN